MGSSTLIDALEDSWRSYSLLDYRSQRAVFGAIVIVVAMTILLWKMMLPLWLLALAVVIYLRLTREKDSL